MKAGETHDGARRANCYRAYGLTFRSDVQIPGAALIAPRQADIEIRLGSAALAGPAAKAGWFSHAPGRLLIEMPGVASFLCEDGVRLLAEPCAGADDALVLSHMVATALPALLWQRGQYVLHAAAVVLPGSTRAIAIAGRSGAGKSTVVLELLAAGAKLVSDDTIRVEAAPEGVWVSGLPGRVMWRGPGQSMAAGAGDSREAMVVPVADRLDGAPLAALFILADERGPNPPEFRTLSGFDGFRALRANRHRPGAPGLMRIEHAFLTLEAAVVAQTPILSWRRTEGMAELTPTETAKLRSFK